MSGGHKVTRVPGTLKVEWVDEGGVPLNLGPVLPPGVTWESAREPAQGRALPSPEHEGRCDQLSPARRSFVHDMDIS